MPTDVLLVDDEPQILTILEESLTASGFSVRTAEGGEAAMAALRQNPPDVMVVDLRMPDINGMDLMRQAKDFLGAGPMVVLTGYSDTKSAVEALRLGAYDYLTKPVDMERLVQTLRNATEHRRLSMENRSLLRRVQEANRIKTEFINGMSHEVRTPLGHIMGFTEILQDTLEGLTEKQVGYLQKVENAAANLLKLFEDVLQFSVLRSGESEVKPVSYPLDSLVNTVVESQIGAATASSIQLKAVSGGAVGNVDPDVAGKILTLLLDNAIKFTPEGGSVTVSTEVVDVRPEEVPDTEEAARALRWFRVAITDTGVGVAEGDQSRIFEVFEQADASLNRVHGGTGLGLALGRSLARIHGGDVLLEDSSPTGSTFSMVLPDLGE